jgi:hypothetical protein
MVFIPTDIETDILSRIIPEQREAWRDGAEIGPAPHTFEQQAAEHAPSCYC